MAIPLYSFNLRLILSKNFIWFTIKNCTALKNYYEIPLTANFSVNRKLWFISPLFLLISRIITEEVTHGLTYVDNNASQLYAIKCFLSPWNGVTISFIKKKESSTSYVLIKAFFISGQLEGVASNFTMRKMASCCVMFSFYWFLIVYWPSFS